MGESREQTANVIFRCVRELSARGTVLERVGGVEALSGGRIEESDLHGVSVEYL